MTTATAATAATVKTAAAKPTAAERAAAIRAGLSSPKAKELGDVALKGAAAGLGAGLVLTVIHKMFGG